MLVKGKEEYSKFKPYCEVTADFASDNSDLDLTECKFIRDDKDIVLLMAAKTIQGLYKSEEHKEDSLCYLVIHSGEYETYSAKEKARVKVQPSEFELLLLNFFENNPDGKGWIENETVLSGHFCINTMPAVLGQVRVMNAWNVIFQLTPLEESKLLVSTEKSSGLGRKGGYSSQKEIDKLEDRRKFILTQFQLGQELTLLDAAIAILGEEATDNQTINDLTIRLVALAIK